MTDTFDVVVIGAGPGGYVAAIKASSLGKSVAIIEANYLGGACLNVGCIPSKSHITSARLMDKAAHAHEFGIDIASVKVNLKQVVERKKRVVEGLRSSLASLIKANGITVFKGRATFKSANEIVIDGSQVIHAHDVIIATGSAPSSLAAIQPDHERIFTSDSIFDLSTLPKTLAVIGGGYIGIEIAGIFAAFGTKVTVVEFLPSILQSQGSSVSSAIAEKMTSRSIVLKTGVGVRSVDKDSLQLTFHLSDNSTLRSDIALVAVGRSPVTAGLGLEKIGVAVDKKGFIEVDSAMRTNIPHIYAIGDVTGKSMLAHAASTQGIVAAKNIAGQAATMRTDVIPSVIFSTPEVGSVGLTPEQARAQGLNIITAKYPLAFLGKAQAEGETDGFVELTADKETLEIYGAQIVGKGASDMICAMALAMTNEVTLDCIAATIHAHPTMSESMLYVAELMLGEGIHSPPQGKRS